ncbi:carbonic anhydrase [Formosa sp. S-31]|uniref:carbonic anhydrase n=1 Tax=Formosa sp. S-31 TaxID=2790949 RepID=UPI003EB87F5D
MKLKLYGFLVVTGLFAWSCENNTDTVHAGLVESDVLHWSYSGETSPEHWKEIEKRSNCDGKKQSPINIITKDAVSVHEENKLNIEYSPLTEIGKVENNGHSIQFDFELGDYIRYNKELYALKQIHFHEPSEHKINGITYPIEVHLVHTNESGQITVLAILGQEGEESQLFEMLESFLPLKTGASKEIHKSIDLSGLFLDKDNYFSYGGSLTTPPCTENVNWVVFKEPIVLSVDEVLKLKNNMPINNYRNEQALNGRVVKYNY